MDAFVRVAELYEFNLLILSEFQLVASLWHLFAFVDFSHLDAIEVVGHADALDVAISNEDLNLVEVEVGCLHEKERIIKRLLSVLLKLVLSDEALRGSSLGLANDSHQLEVSLVKWFHLSLTASHFNYFWNTRVSIIYK